MWARVSQACRKYQQKIADEASARLLSTVLLCCGLLFDKRVQVKANDKHSHPFGSRQNKPILDRIPAEETKRNYRPPIQRDHV